jgi:thioredoxin 1
MPITGLGSSMNLNALGAPVDNVQTVTAINFAQKVLGAPGPVAVEFMSYGCSHCKKAEPFVQEAAEKLVGKVTVFRVNVPSQPALANQYGIMVLPSLFVVGKDGKCLNKAAQIGTLDDEIKKQLKK